MSHGPVDIIAAKDGQVLLIQVKSGRSRVKPCMVEEIGNWAEAFDASAEIWFFRNGGVLEKKVLRTSKRRPIYRKTA